MFQAYRVWRIGAVVVLGLLALGVAACGGTTDSAPAATPILTLKVTLTPAAGYKTFISRIFPYAVAYPSSWQEQGEASAGNIRADVFIGPRANDYTTNINIQALPTTSDNDSYFRERMAELKTQSVTDITTATRSVAGYPANVVEWRASDPNFKIIGRQVIFVVGSRAWIVSLSASPDAFVANRDIFEKVLDNLVIVG